MVSVFLVVVIVWSVVAILFLGFFLLANSYAKDRGFLTQNDHTLLAVMASVWPVFLAFAFAFHFFKALSPRK